MFDTSLHLLKGIDGRGCFDIDLKYLKLNCDIVRMILSGDKTQIRVCPLPAKIDRKKVKKTE